MKNELCPDVIFLPSESGVLAHNVRAHTFVELSLPLFCALMGEKMEGALEASDRTRFSSADGLLEDPTGLDRSSGNAPGQKIRFQNLSEATTYLEKHLIWVRDRQVYRQYFQVKQGPLDRKHFGSFHQQLGVELSLKRKVDPNAWWYAQKFDPETGRLRDNLYRYIQQEFIDHYFASKDFTGKTVLDFGCGSGYGSTAFIKAGAQVLGVDPNPDLLKIGEQRLGKSFKPVLLKLDATDPLEGLPNEKVDFVWMSDVFLFYFYAMDAKPPKVSAARLLSRLAESLKPGGTLVIMQPHGTFWLTPWLGDERYPFTVLTEYLHKVYSVSPNLSEISAAIAESGLLIRRIYEPVAGPDARDKIPRGAAFATEFPLWWVFETLKP